MFTKSILYVVTLMLLFFPGVREGLSQPSSPVGKAPEIALGEVIVKIREFESPSSLLKILELQIEVLNQSPQSVVPPNSIKVSVTPKEIKFAATGPASELTLTPEEATLGLPLLPKAGRVMIIGYPFQTENPQSITFEVQLNPPDGEKKIVTWENRQPLHTSP
ncbi:MAG: hypothetical protein ACE144_18725 [Thermodesulfobacteriota bacterium]